MFIRVIRGWVLTVRQEELATNGTNLHEFSIHQYGLVAKAREGNMRLTREQILSILGIITRLTGENATVSLFGSRLNDQARGGDVDLLIETGSPLTLIDRARIKMHLEKRLGLPVDIITQSRNDTPTPFQRLAGAQAIRLEATV